MNTDLLNSEISKAGISLNIIYYEETESTNLSAKKILAEDPFTDNTLILTSHQTQGKGRFDRQWKTSPSKDLTFSLVKSINIGFDEVHLVNFYTSYILLKSLKDLLSLNGRHEISVKWPNDILLNGKKVAGILLDVKDLNFNNKKFIIGIGLNVNSCDFPEELIMKATSLKNEVKSEISREEFLICFIKKFYENISLIKNRNELMKSWLMHTDIIGKRINFKIVEDEEEMSVTVLDIDTDGGLKVKLDNERVKKFYSGEISLIYNKNLQ